MTTFIVSFFVIAVAVLAMAVGVIVRGRSIKGSCGGLNNIDGLQGSCDICSGDGKCRENKSTVAD